MQGAISRELTREAGMTQPFTLLLVHRGAMIEKIKRFLYLGCLEVSFKSCIFVLPFLTSVSFNLVIFLNFLNLKILRLLLKLKMTHLRYKGAGGSEVDFHFLNVSDRGGCQLPGTSFR